MNVFTLRCSKCEGGTKVNSLVFKQRSGAGLAYTCAHCSADLVKTGYRPKHGKTDSQKRSIKQEKSVARRTGGRTTPGSGNQPGAKGDVRAVASSVTECKCTTRKSFTLKLADLMKIENASHAGENPIMEIEFQGVSPKKRFVVLPGWLYDYYASLSGDA